MLIVGLPVQPHAGNRQDTNRMPKTDIKIQCKRHIRAFKLGRSQSF